MLNRGTISDAKGKMARWFGRREIRRHLCILTVFIVVHITLSTRWLLTGVIQRRTISGVSEIVRVPNSVEQQIPDYFWRRISPNMTFYSAYYDDRAVLSTPAEITILGFVKHPNLEKDYYCQILYKNSSCKVERSKLSLLARDHWVGSNGKPLYRPVSLKCRLTTKEMPVSVAFSFTDQCKHSESTHAIQIIDRKREKKLTFAVCLGSPMFGKIKALDVVSSFEMNRLLGAEFFTIYTYKIPWEISTVLQKYVQEGTAEVVETWAKGLPQSVHYYGQLLSTNDCLYRNIYRAKYLVYCDFDEVIMPRRHLNWSSLLEEIDRPDQGAFLFENSYMYQISSKRTRLCSKGSHSNILQPRFLTAKLRREAIQDHKRTKYIAKTDVLLVPQIHYAYRLAEGYKAGRIDLNEARLYHYRVRMKDVPKKEETVTDNSMVYYAERLKQRVADRLCV